ncbi:MAG: ABC transporter permease [Verrucomicrobiota bacterium]
MNDLKFAMRQWFKHPGFTAVAVLTLALGIGSNTAMFSILHAILLKPLPYPEPDRLVTLWERDLQRGLEQDRVSGPNYLDWRAQNSVFADLAVSPGWVGSSEFNLLLGDTTVKVPGSYVSSSLFQTLGQQPLLGRAFGPEEDRKQGHQTAVLSYELWQRHFAGDFNIIGKTLAVDTFGRRDYTIVGVMPPGFGQPSPAQVWLPLGWMGVSLDERRSAHWHHVLARLKPGVTIAQAQAQMNTIQARLKQAYPNVAMGNEVVIVPLLDQAVGRNMRTALFILWGVVAGVLLIACANVANLMLARAAARQKEIALRFVLGASRWRLVRQLTVESILLASLGGAAGVALAFYALDLFIALSPASLPRLAEVELNGTALWFTLGLSVLTGILFGIAPAWQCSRSDLNEALKESARGATSSAATSRTRNALVVAEVALSLVLLISAGLMLQSFRHMLEADRGFNAEHLLTAHLDFSVSGFTTWVRPTATRPQVRLQELMDRLRAYPRVQAVGASSVFLRRENKPPNQPFTIFGRPVAQQDEMPTADFKGISPGWLEAIGARVLHGRDILESDQLGTPGVALVNESFARRYFPNQNPIGKRLSFDHPPKPLDARDVHGIPVWAEIVGVVSDLKSLHPTPQAVPEVYRPHWQWPMQGPTILVRTSGDPAGMAAAILRETKAILPNLPPPVIRTMDHVLAESVAQPRLQSTLLSCFGLIALVLAAVGLYGVLAYAVTQRTHELGIRMALGAGRRNILALVLGQGVRLALLGIGLGLIGAITLTRVMRALLYEITPTDPLTFAGVTLLLIVVALLASWIPARRAMKVHPMEALRYE